jgi:hypothetical protein
MEPGDRPIAVDLADLAIASAASTRIVTGLLPARAPPRGDARGAERVA